MFSSDIGPFSVGKSSQMKRDRLDLPFLFHPAERLTRTGPLASYRNLSFKSRGNSKRVVNPWYLLRYSILNITSKNRNYCQEIDANNPYIFNEISDTTAFLTYPLTALIEALSATAWSGRVQVSHTRLSAGSRLLIFVNSFRVISTKRYIAFP